MALKIYTKTGDKGTTSLIGGTKVSKADIRIETYGTVDELNSWIGLVNDQLNHKHSKKILKEIQDRLFTIGSSLACDPEKETKMKIPDVHETDIELLEKEIDRRLYSLSASFSNCCLDSISEILLLIFLIESVISEGNLEDVGLRSSAFSL